MKTRAIAVVHSHVIKGDDNGIIDLSNDLIAIQTNKALKGSGGMSLTLVARRNYLNLIYPNDVINLYIDPGDGKRGFVRTFFGYIDRIERSVSTDDKGATSTVFRIACTDMTKVFDRTDVYFNPNLANRKDFLETRFGQSQLAGHALRTAGIYAHGSPADMVENLVTMLLGFGAQWILPSSYINNAKGLDRNKENRINRTKARVPSTEQQWFTDLGGVPNNVSNLDKEIEDLLKQQDELIKTDDLDALAKVNTALANRQAIADLLEGSPQFRAWLTAQSSAVNQKPTILDLIDLSFIEAMSIDGWIASTSIWQKQGSLASLMYGYSNEVVNELFFDLRPAMVDGGEGMSDSCFGKTYSYESDELNINLEGTDGFPAAVPAVKYVPAIVMREYPYSTSEGIDLTNLFISDIGGVFEFVPFGPVFGMGVSTEPGEPKRVVYDYNTVPYVKEKGGLSPISNQFTSISKPLKHLDVIPITNQDVKEDSLGRSDNDVFNLFALYAEDSLQQQYKYLLQDLFPIVTPVSIERNGLRVMEMSSMFANFSESNKVEGSGIDTASIRQNLARWAFLLDHWNQHNNEYLNGDMTLRGMPEIRVGMRLDHVDRHESYYVEEVRHNWSYPDAMTTTVTVSRGQRNDPFPAYIPPLVTRDFGKPKTLQDIEYIASKGGAKIPLGDNLADQGFVLSDVRDDVQSVTSFAGESVVTENGNTILSGGDRTDAGRLSKFFHVNPVRATETSEQGTPVDRAFHNTNYIDSPTEITNGAYIPAYPAEAPRTGFTTSESAEVVAIRDIDPEEWKTLVEELGEEGARNALNLTDE
jgi:hypothetical protein